MRIVLFYLQKKEKGGVKLGKGDRKTKKGKIWRGTYGKYRARKKKKK